MKITKATNKQMAEINKLIREIESICPQGEKVPKGVRWALRKELIDLLDEEQASRIIATLKETCQYNLAYKDGYEDCLKVRCIRWPKIIWEGK